MIELLSNLPDNTVGIAAFGEVDVADYEAVLIPAVEAALKKHDKVRLLYELRSDFTGFTPSAMGRHEAGSSSFHRVGESRGGRCA